MYQAQNIARVLFQWPTVTILTKQEGLDIINQRITCILGYFDTYSTLLVTLQSFNSSSIKVTTCPCTRHATISITNNDLCSQNLPPKKTLVACLKQGTTTIAIPPMLWFGFSFLWAVARHIVYNAFFKWFWSFWISFSIYALLNDVHCSSKSTFEECPVKLNRFLENAYIFNMNFSIDWAVMHHSLILNKFGKNLSELEIFIWQKLLHEFNITDLRLNVLPFIKTKFLFDTFYNYVIFWVKLIY